MLVELLPLMKGIDKEGRRRCRVLLKVEILLSFILYLPIKKISKDIISVLELLEINAKENKKLDYFMIISLIFIALYHSFLSF